MTYYKSIDKYVRVSNELFKEFDRLYKRKEECELVYFNNSNDKVSIKSKILKFLNIDGSEFMDVKEGKRIRNSYANPGANVNFVEQKNENTFRVRTYEKGVENETLACGTGVTAVAVGMHKIGKTKKNIINLPVEGGELQVTFDEENGNYYNIFLTGLALLVFKGTITI